MPIQMNQVVDRGINVAVSRRLGLGDTALSLLPELGINMVLPSDELLFHMGWRRYQRQVIVNALAANFSNARIRNPAGSNILVLVDTILADVGTAGSNIDMSIIAANTDFATIDLGAIVRDARQIGPTGANAGAAIVSHENNAVAITDAGLVIRLGANLSSTIPGAPWILLPGTVLKIGNNVPNDKFELTFFWRERILNDQENVP